MILIIIRAISGNTVKPTGKTRGITQSEQSFPGFEKRLLAQFAPYAIVTYHTDEVATDAIIIAFIEFLKGQMVPSLCVSHKLTFVENIVRRVGRRIIDFIRHPCTLSG
jgi:hypothetical protein